MAGRNGHIIKKAETFPLVPPIVMGAVIMTVMARRPDSTECIIQLPFENIIGCLDNPFHRLKCCLVGEAGLPDRSKMVFRMNAANAFYRLFIRNRDDYITYLLFKP